MSVVDNSKPWRHDDGRFEDQQRLLPGPTRDKICGRVLSGVEGRFVTQRLASDVGCLAKPVSFMSPMPPATPSLPFPNPLFSEDSIARVWICRRQRDYVVLRR